VPRLRSPRRSACSFAGEPARRETRGSGAGRAVAESIVLFVVADPGDEARLAALRVPSVRCELATLAAKELPEPASEFDAVVFDARGLAADARERLRAGVCSVASRDPSCAILVVVETENGFSEEVAAAGVWDVVRDDELSDRLPLLLEAATRITRLRRRAERRRSQRSEPAAADDADQPRQMVGTSEAIREVFALIRRTASCDVPVLVTGESGTGKELAALAIHERSRRAEGPFVAINCSAIPDTLLESELFGVERGAFTGAAHSRKGRFEAADGGTLFLDEIGDLAPPLQVKLLRFLQDHTIEHVGGTGSKHVDVRVIAATHRDLKAMVDENSFRQDLYFRLAVLTIHMPPLREREEDVVLMARFFLQRYRGDSARPLNGYTREAIDALLAHPWPGNIRELINRVRRAVVVAEGPLVTAADLDLDASEGGKRIPLLRDARREVERRCVRMALQRADGNKREAARLLGISRTQLYELLARQEKEPASGWAPAGTSD